MSENELEVEKYLVSEGETLIGISIKLNININTLKRLNNIYSNTIFPGQVNNHFLSLSHTLTLFLSLILF